MKKTLFILIFGFFVFSGCTGVKTVATGLENESFLVLIGDAKNYDGGVEVDVDGEIIFIAKPTKDYKKHPSGEIYAISPGKHIVMVSHGGNVLFKKQIFVSAQETKKIMLP